MNFKIYDRKSSGLRVGKPTVSVNKSGMFSFSKRAAELIGFDLGSKLVLVQDIDKPKDWYLVKKDTEDAFEVRGKSLEGGGTLCIASSVAMNRLKESLSLNGSTRSMSFLIGAEPVKVDEMDLWPIITKSLNLKEDIEKKLG